MSNDSGSGSVLGCLLILTSPIIAALLLIWAVASFTEWFGGLRFAPILGAVVVSILMAALVALVVYCGVMIVRAVRAYLGTAHQLAADAQAADPDTSVTWWGTVRAQWDRMRQFAPHVAKAALFTAIGALVTIATAYSIDDFVELWSNALAKAR